MEILRGLAALVLFGLAIASVLSGLKADAKAKGATRSDGCRITVCR